MNIREKIDDCKIKMNDVLNLKSEIDRQYDEFKKNMIPQEETLKKLQSDLGLYIDNNIISVRFGDLLDELAKLANIKRSCIKYVIKTNLMTYNSNDSINELIDRRIDKISASVNIEYKKYFNYNFSFPIDVTNEEILNKLKKITIKLNNRLIDRQYEYHIENDAQDFIINLSLIDLMQQQAFFEPNDLFIDAVQNCINKKKNETKVKKIGGIT